MPDQDVNHEQNFMDSLAEQEEAKFMQNFVQAPEARAKMDPLAGVPPELTAELAGAMSSAPEIARAVLALPPEQQPTVVIPVDVPDVDIGTGVEFAPPVRIPAHTEPIRMPFFEFDAVLREGGEGFGAEPKSILNTILLATAVGGGAAAQGAGLANRALGALRGAVGFETMGLSELPIIGAQITRSLVRARRIAKIVQQAATETGPAQTADVILSRARAAQKIIELEELPLPPEGIFSRATIQPNAEVGKAIGAPVARLSIDDAAFVNVAKEGEEFSIGGIHVEPAFQGKGLSKDAILAGIAHAEKQGARGVNLGRAAVGEPATEPILQSIASLEQEGLIQVAEAGGRRTAALTPKGQQEVARRFLDPLPPPPLPHQTQFGKVSGPEATRDLIARVNVGVKDLAEIQKRGIVTHPETLTEAAKSKLTIEDILRRQPGQAFANAAEQTRARVLNASLAHETRELYKQVVAGTAGVDDLKRALVISGHVSARVEAGIAETARSLEAAKITVGPTASAADLNKLLSQVSVDAAKVGEGISQPRFLKMAGEVLAQDEASQGRFARFVANFPEAFREAYFGTILGLRSVVRNMGGNTLMFTNSVWERNLAQRLGTSIAPGEEGALLAGSWQAQRSALKSAVHTMKTGESQFYGTKFDQPLRRAITAENLGMEGVPFFSRGIDYLGMGFRAGPRMMLAGDEYSRVVNFWGEVSALSWREAHALSGGDPTKLSAAYAKLMDNPPARVLRQALAASQERTFNKELTGRLASAQQAMSHPITQFLVNPFFKTPVNIMEQSLQRTPGVGLLLSSFRRELEAGGASAQLAMAKQANGAILVGMAMMLESQGLVTGNGPTHAGLKEHLKGLGWQRMSVWEPASSKYVAMEGMEPITTVLGLGADLSMWLRELRIMGVPADHPDVQALIGAVVLSTTKNFVNKSFMQGYEDFLGALESQSNLGKISNFMERKIGSIMAPSTIRGIAQTVDPELKEIHSLKDRLFASWPGLSSYTFPHRNIITGEPIMTEGAARLFFIPGTEVASPFFLSSIKDDPVQHEIVRLGGAGISKPQPVIFGRRPAEFPMREPSMQEGVGLDGAEYDRMVVLMTTSKINGKTLHQALQAEMSKPSYQKATDGIDGGKAAHLRATYQGYLQNARGKLLEESDRIKGEFEKKITRIRETLIPGVASPEKAELRGRSTVPLPPGQ